jgi:hypothetical protein
MNDVTPNDVIRGTWRWFPAAVIVTAVALVLIGGVTLVCWKAGWWFAARSAANQTKVIENGPGYQTAKTDDLNSQIANVLDLTTSMIGTSGSEYAALHAQRLGDARLACADASQITTIPADQQGWVSANCTDGTLNPASPLLK